MRKHIPILLIGVTLLTLASCGKTPEPVATQSGTTGAESSPYTLEQYESMFAAEAAKPFSVNSGSITTTDLNAHIRSGTRNIRELIESLTGSDMATITKRSYLRSYMGDYSGALAERDTLCKVDTTQCPQPTILLDVGTARDQSGETIENPRVYLNGQPLKMESAIAQPAVYSDMVQRVRVEAEGYLDSYAKLDDVGKNAYKTLAIKPTMAKSDMKIKMDNQSGGTYTAGNGTGSITYTLAPDTFTTMDGKKVTGTVDLYLFALTKGDNSLSAFQLDVFSASGTNVGGGMVTDGMPFVIAYQDGNVLKISKPIDGIGQIGKGEFKMDFEGVPKNTWLKFEELMKYGIPGFWRLDRNSGVWTESEMQILDAAGHYHFLFL